MKIDDKQSLRKSATVDTKKSDEGDVSKERTQPSQSTNQETLITSSFSRLKNSSTRVGAQKKVKSTPPAPPPSGFTMSSKRMTGEEYRKQNPPHVQEAILKEVRRNYDVEATELAEPFR